MAVQNGSAVLVRTSQAEIAEAEGEVGALVDFGEEPGALGVGGAEDVIATHAAGADERPGT